MAMSWKRYGLLMTLILICTSGFAAVPELKPGAPAQYTVERSDTVWSVASRYLSDPWQWADIWDQTSQNRHPFHLYPGDVLTIKRVNGRERVSLGRARRTLKPMRTVKLSPRTRKVTLSEAGVIPVVPLEAIKPFMTGNQVIDINAYERSPVIVGNAQQRMVLAVSDKVYVVGDLHPEITDYQIYHMGQTYKDPDTQEVLGYSGIYLGRARYREAGHPAIFEITDVHQEIVRGDHLLPSSKTDQMTPVFSLQAPKQAVEGHILSMLQFGLGEVAKLGPVVIDRGADAGLAVGDVLTIYKPGDVIADPTAEKKSHHKKDQHFLKLPDGKIGELMIFRTFDRLSFGLVLTAHAPVEAMDVVKSPA